MCKNRIHYYNSFTPYVVTFAHCVGAADANDLALLKEVLDSLEHMNSSQHSQRQYKLCNALYRIAEEHLASKVPNCAPAQTEEYVDNGTWWFNSDQLLSSLIDGRTGEWDGLNLDHVNLNLGDRIRTDNTPEL